MEWAPAQSRNWSRSNRGQPDSGGRGLISRPPSGSRPEPVIFLDVQYQFDWSVVTDRWPQFVEGAWVDVWIAVLGFGFACLIGLFNALLRTSGINIFSV